MSNATISKAVTPATGITVEVADITPAMAAEMLERNHKNRRIRQDAVDVYAAEMKAGKWRLTGDGPRFNTDGELMDGQHRLMAIIKAGLPVQMFVFRNIPDIARPVIDTNIRRTPADFLHWSGEKDTILLSSTVRFAIVIERYAGRAFKGRIATQEIQDWVTDHPEIRSAVHTGRKCYTIGMAPSVLSYGYYELRKIEETQAAEFYFSMAEREGLFRGDPRHALVRRFDQARRGRERLPATVQLSILYRAWNAWRKGEQTQFIRVQSSAGGDVAIPKPI